MKNRAAYELVGTLAVLLVAATIATVTLARRPCSMTLVPLPEPADWRSWTVFPRDEHGALPGGFEVASDPPNMDAQYVHGLLNPMLSHPNVCPDGRLSLRDWFRNYGGEPAYVRSPYELSLSADGPRERFVVSGLPSQRTQAASPASLTAEATFVLAFRVSSEQRWVFLTPFARDAFVALLAAAVIASVALGSALRLRRVARGVGDEARFVEVSRGTVTLVRGAAPYSVVDASKGPLLVEPCDRGASMVPETYRDAPTLRVSRIFAGTRATVLEGIEAREGARLRAATRLAIVIAVGLALDAVVRAF